MGRSLSLQRYRQLAIVTTLGICLLVVAGGVVRLTGSGLGCDDWPNCNESSFIDVSSGHTAIEQVNRLLSGLIGVPTLALAIGSFFVANRRGVRWPAIGVLVTVLANGVVGGIAVRGDLHPSLVQSHFLLAMLSIAFGLIAMRRSAPEPIVLRRPGLGPALLGALTLAALVTGTVVTGTGPHAGDEDVRRFDFDISTVAQIHSVTVLIALAVSLWLAYDLRHSGRMSSTSLLSGWMFIGFVQAGVGYTQYFNGVPELLVGAHIALATALWATTVLIVIDFAAQSAVFHEDEDGGPRGERFIDSPRVHV